MSHGSRSLRATLAAVAILALLSPAAQALLVPSTPLVLPTPQARHEWTHVTENVTAWTPWQGEPVAAGGGRVYGLFSQHVSGFGVNILRVHAHDAATGAPLWLGSELFGFPHGPEALTIATGPDGGVVVAGAAGTKISTWTTVAALAAWDGETGQALWTWRGDAFPHSYVRDVTFDAWGATVFVTLATYNGNAAARGLSFDARSGNLLWVHDAVDGADPRAAALSPDGMVLYVAAEAPGGMPGEFVLYAVDTRYGQVLWQVRRDVPLGPAGWSTVRPMDLAVTPDGGLLVVSGVVQDWSNPRSFHVALDSQLQVTRWQRAGIQGELLGAALSPDGTLLHAYAGHDWNRHTSVYTLAVDDGSTRWTKHFGGFAARAAAAGDDALLVGGSYAPPGSNNTTIMRVRAFVPETGHEWPLPVPAAAQSSSTSTLVTGGAASADGATLFLGGVEFTAQPASSPQPMLARYAAGASIG